MTITVLSMKFACPFETVRLFTSFPVILIHKTSARALKIEAGVITMPDVHLRVLEVRLPSMEVSAKNLMIYSQLTSDPKRVKRDVRGGRLDLNCAKSMRFHITATPDNSINFWLVKHAYFGRSKTLGRCTIPLDWFPVERVVREWFPLIETDTKFTKTTLLLDVHVASANARPFKATFARLNVIPTWPRPVDEFVEFREQQVIFVVQGQPEASQVVPEPFSSSIDSMTGPGWARYPTSGSGDAADMSSFVVE
jgi:hypothetical protein